MLGEVRVGDWVRSYSPGLWRVYRIIGGFYELRYCLDQKKRKSKRTIVLSKKMVDASWTTGFAAESCELALVQPLLDRERGRLDLYIAKHPQVLHDFEAFVPRSVDFLLSLRLRIPETAPVCAVRRLAEGAFDGMDELGFTNQEVLERVAGSSLGRRVSSGGRSLTIQFVCRDHEIREDEFVFRSFDVLPF